MLNGGGYSLRKVVRGRLEQFERKKRVMNILYKRIKEETVVLQRIRLEWVLAWGL